MESQVWDSIFFISRTSVGDSVGRFSPLTCQCLAWLCFNLMFCLLRALLFFCPQRRFGTRSLNSCQSWKAVFLPIDIRRLPCRNTQHSPVREILCLTQKLNHFSYRLLSDFARVWLPAAAICLHCRTPARAKMIQTTQLLDKYNLEPS